MGKVFQKKMSTSLIEREHHHENESKANKLEKSFKVANNNRTFWDRPSFSGRTYLLLLILSWKPDREIYIITKSPPEQRSNFKFKFKDIGEEIKSLNEYENAIIVFHDILGSSKS